MNSRIPYEEDVLLSHYGEEYSEYMGSTIIGIPFVSTRAVAKRKVTEAGARNSASSNSPAAMASSTGAATETEDKKDS
jgi:hypothetical protein